MKTLRTKPIRETHGPGHQRTDHGGMSSTPSHPDLQMAPTSETDVIQMEPAEEEEMPQIFEEEHIEIDHDHCEDRLSVEDELDIKNREIVMIDRDDVPDMKAEFQDRGEAQKYMNEVIPPEVKHRYRCLPKPGYSGDYAIYKHKDYKEDWKKQ